MEVLVLEASGRVGGKVRTELRDGLVFEAGADSFITAKPEILDLAGELGLSEELVKTHPSRRAVYVYSGGRLLPLPNGTGLLPARLWPFLRSELLSWEGKARVALEYLLPPAEGEQDESLARFVRRRLGPEALEKIAGPLLAGIYAGDPEQMSLESTFPQLKEMERRGGLLRTLWKKKALPPSDHSLFMTFRGGLSRLIEALALGLPPRTVRTQTEVAALRREGALWRAQTSAGAFPADAVISALPANVLAGIVSDLDFELSCVLREIPFVSTATVSFVYEGKGFPDPLDGFGFLVPRSEGLKLSAATYTSTKFPGRAPPGLVLIRCFLGGAGREEIAEAEEDAVARTARKELAQILRLGDRHPRMTRVARWIKANPQYTVGHGLRLRRIESCLQGHRGLFLAGCSYEGVGLPDCVRSGRAAAAKAWSAVLSRAPAGAA